MFPAPPRNFLFCEELMSCDHSAKLDKELVREGLATPRSWRSAAVMRTWAFRALPFMDTLTEDASGVTNSVPVRYAVSHGTDDTHTRLADSGSTQSTRTRDPGSAPDAPNLQSLRDTHARYPRVEQHNSTHHLSARLCRGGRGVKEQAVNVSVHGAMCDSVCLVPWLQ